MTLEVIGAGFGRTGTNSLKSALEMLGFAPCHHMFVLHDRPDTLAEWEAIADGAPPDWDHMFAGYKAQLDWPGVFYWRELAAHFPDAKVILSVRDPKAWHASILKTIAPTLAARGRRETEFLNRLAFHNHKTFGLQTFGGRIEDPDHALKVFADHVAEVRDTVPADRLLVYEVGQGWGPLCRFLNRPVPDAPFPRGNDTRAFQDRFLKGRG